MTRLSIVLTALVFVSTLRPGAQQGSLTPRDLVGTWTLSSMQQRVETPTPATVQNPRGLLVFDAAGHTIEVITRSSLPAPGGDPLTRFQSFGGSWGRYRVDPREARITYSPAGGVSPNVMGTTFARQLALNGDILTITSLPGELHAQGVTRWTWERVPLVDHLSDGYRKVIGFWEHVNEQRVNLTTGVASPETARAPSVIVYTPSGYVAVHFPPRDRARFAAAEPTDAEARAALAGYIGYYGALGVYPGMVFHQILGGFNPVAGSTLKRHFELKGEELHIRLAPTTNQQGQRQQTVVLLKRLSGEKEMIP